METERTWIIVCLFVIYALGGGHCECPDNFYDSGPATQETLVTTYISVEYQLEEKPSQCRLVYQSPVNATLFQGMLAAHQQHRENFTFEYDTYKQFGHHITVINNVRGHDTFHWALHHGDTWETADYGVDFLYIEHNILFLYRYTEYNGGEFKPSNFTGDCHSVTDDIIASFPLDDIVVYVSVSTQNTAQFTNGTFAGPMCKRLVLTARESSLHAVTLATNDQHVISFASPCNNDQ